ALVLFTSYLNPRGLHSFPTRRSSDLSGLGAAAPLRSPAVSRALEGISKPAAGAGTPSALRQCPTARSHRTLRGSLERQRRTRCSDRKSTRLNSSHVKISYAVFCLKKK